MTPLHCLQNVQPGDIIFVSNGGRYLAMNKPMICGKTAIIDAISQTGMRRYYHFSLGVGDYYSKIVKAYR